MHIGFIHLGRENLGIEYLSAVLKRGGHKTSLLSDPALFSVIDNVFYSPFIERLFIKWDKFPDTVSKSDYDILLFSVYSNTYKWACNIAREIKKKKDIPIVFGGIHPTLKPVDVIKNKFVDFVISGEGEECILSLIEAIIKNKIPEDIPNLYYKKEGIVYEPKSFTFIKDLNILPFPDKEIFKDYISFKDDYMIMTTRGCVYNCSFCCEGSVRGRFGEGFFRRRSVDSVIEELSLAKERYKITNAIFCDSIFFNDKEWLRKFSERYINLINIPYKCSGHVEPFDEETASLLKDSGCYCVAFGIESFNEDKKKRILNRYETNDTIKRAFDICEDIKLWFDVDMLFGVPEHTEEDYLLASNILKDYKSLNRIKCFELSYYPETAIVKEGVKKGYLTSEDKKRIDEGDVGDWFHIPFKTNYRDKKGARAFKSYFKILPILPKRFINFINRNKIYRYFHLIPGFLIISIQLIIAGRNKDWRFRIYIKNYYKHLLSTFSG